MKNQWKKLALAVGCSLLVLGQVPVTVHAEETVATVQGDAKAKYLAATNLEWTDDFGIKFTNPNSDPLSVIVYIKNVTTGDSTRIAIDDEKRGFASGENTIDADDLQDGLNDSGDYYFRVQLGGADLSDPSPTKSYTKREQLPDVNVESFSVDENKVAHIKVTLPGNYVLGVDYEFEYELFWKDISLEVSKSKGDTCDDLKLSDEYHTVKITAKSLKKDLYKNSAAVILPEGTKAPETHSNTSTNGCNHDYEWVQVNPATATEDALEAYTCKHCGRVSEYMKAPNTAYAQFNKDAISAIDKAAANATVTLKTNMWVSFYDSVIDMMKKRPDVTVVVNYFYKGTRYVMTIPAGADLSALQASEGYYGFRYLDGFFPAQVN